MLDQNEVSVVLRCTSAWLSNFECIRQDVGTAVQNIDERPERDGYRTSHKFSRGFSFRAFNLYLRH